MDMPDFELERTNYGWAYRLAGKLSPPFPSHEAALIAAREASAKRHDELGDPPADFCELLARKHQGHGPDGENH
jgi:hypothetical protein